MFDSPDGESAAQTVASLTSTRVLARNFAINLVGWIAPALLAVVAIPVLIPALGTDRFGVLTLAWTVIGQFSLLDLGLSRALTQLLAERMGRGETRDVPALVWSALAVMLAAGVVAAGALAFTAEPLARAALPGSAELHAEVEQSIRWLALALPFVVVTAGFRAVLEAAQRFALINALRVPLGVLTFAGPMLALPFSRSLVPAIAVLAVGRVLLAVAHLVVCARVFPTLRRRGAITAPLVRSLMVNGGWMTVSNVLHPLLATADRFVIGALISARAVAFYTTPHEIVSKMLLFTGALLPVLFPAVAATFARQPERAAALFDRASRLTYCCLFPVTLVLVLFAREGLGLWLGPEFAAESTGVFRALVLAIFVNAVGQSGYTLVQAVGRADLSGKLHLAQLPLYAAALAWALPRYGIIGAAVVWSLRLMVDAVAFLVAAGRLLPAAAPAVRGACTRLAIAVPLLLASMLVETPLHKLATLAVALPLFAWATWHALMTAEERAYLSATLRIAPSR